ncbi:DUF3885 domain-containing protein [Gottfriedia acidiceleris]|uniref:DUF3885 domain-containing protein n=1 Tax=Gottfriedia acidiceleris TaxID=371036 RepID=A0ABY4JRH1_9BACI|nr:DUF3885 domain-containing protein [Gottfriedia acidiceleris]UPM56399.1 DUF3885 domain-containing protein [Gottfriedia acidiceleris]
MRDTYVTYNEWILDYDKPNIEMVLS